MSLVLIGLAAYLMSLGTIEAPHSPSGTLPDRFDSTQVALERAGDGDDGSAAVVLFTGLTPETFGALQPKAGELGGPLVPNEAMDAAIVPVEVDSGSLAENADAVGQLRERAAADLPPGVTSQVTEPAAISTDLSGVFSGANVKLLTVTAVVVSVLLVFTYRSPVLWIIPLAVIALADRLVAATYPRVLDALGMTWDASTGGILSVLVFGAGTNYALLLISRYRDELTAGGDRFEAMSRSWLPTVKTIGASALTVILDVLCLLLSQTPTTRALGAGAAFGVAVALFFGAVVLPGVLVLFGRWIF